METPLPWFAWNGAEGSPGKDEKNMDYLEIEKVIGREIIAVSYTHLNYVRKYIDNLYWYWFSFIVLYWYELDKTNYRRFVIADIVMPGGKTWVLLS